ncbi:MAG: FlgD immunoglobulin-like domain containing protein [Candidatus Eisenbacteria bacterium]
MTEAHPTRLCIAVALAVLLLVGGSGAAGDDAGTTLVYPPFGHCLGIHRATAFHLFLYLGTRTRFNEPAGLAAVKLDALDDPSTTSDDDELTVFGLNSGQCEIIFNTSLVSVDTYGNCGSGRGQFRNPMGIAADSRGNVFVADTGNHRVVRLLYSDGRLEFVKSFGSEGSGELGFSGPSQVALGESGTLYVADTGNDRVVTMTSEGSRLSEVTGDEGSGVALDRPVGLAVVEADDPWISRRKDFMVVSDRGGERLVKLSLDGRVLAVTTTADLNFPSARFNSLAIDYYGGVYATDRTNGRIHKFDGDLRHVTSIGSSGTGNMELDEPRGITLYRRFGQIFITERTGAQYFWIGTDILDLEVSPDRIQPGEGELRLRYFLTEVARVTVELVDTDGAVVHTLVSNRRRATGENLERWDGMLGRLGGPAPPGSYTLRVTATPTYSSGEYFHDTASTPLLVGQAASR